MMRSHRLLKHLNLPTSSQKVITSNDLKKVIILQVFKNYSLLLLFVLNTTYFTV